jgi:hypothetical protein
VVQITLSVTKDSSVQVTLSFILTMALDAALKREDGNKTYCLQGSKTKKLTLAHKNRCRLTKVKSELSCLPFVAERIQERLAIPFKVKGQEVVTTASIGIAFCATSYTNS